MNQLDGALYFGYYNELCYKSKDNPDASCYIWPTMVSDSEVFSYIWIDQGIHSGTNPIPRPTRSLKTVIMSRFADAIRAFPAWVMAVYGQH